MSIHVATIGWERADAVFTDNRYSRAHSWHFDGGAVVPASSSPHVVRVPLSNPANVDPEEAFVASLSSCHMLWFLDIARSAGYLVERYVDQAKGHMERAADGKSWIALVELAPAVAFSGAKIPDDAVLRHLHHQAHEECFLARSVKSEIRIEGSWSHAAS
ncbi:OsmC family protein [Collimonas sp. OK412]|jgi:organic hydroperoxide reductase OsmC/OhrA|uniref:OsmC family protein n=1 Tax=Collimonas sp. (strain OK412) TaxID=1801619 RepID=UPI0008E060AF|nr:OsmC family protein [Collimonas sp. OK412]SFD26534.1 Organic hydroperoxide reductase OsmC/OhrA [Collimonas sp. OK412]